MWEQLSNLEKMLVTAFVAALSQLIMGKTMKKLLLLPLEWITSKSSNKIDDVLVKSAEEDLGITNTLDEIQKKEKPDGK